MNDSQLIHHSKTWDRSGVIIAGLCLAHCLAFPFIIAAIPATRVYFNNPIFEVTILSLGVIVGSISFHTSYKKHRKIYPMILGILGVAFLFANLFILPLSDGGHTHHVLSEHESFSFGNLDPLMILGGLFLILGHIWNIHACHCFCDKSCHSPEHEHQHH